MQRKCGTESPRPAYAEPPLEFALFDPGGDFGFHGKTDVGCSPPKRELARARKRKTHMERRLSTPWIDTPNSVVVIGVLEFFGSLLALLVSVVFLWSEIDRYQLSKRFEQLYGPTSAFHFINPAFYLVYMVLPMSFGLLGVVCAFGLPRLREWARKGTLFLGTVPVLVCGLLVLFRPAAVFPPDPSQGTILAFGGGIYLALFLYLLVVLIPVSIWWQILLTRKNVSALFQ
jgi:hypothetical protein